MSEPDDITVPEAADLLGLTRQRVDQYVRDGRLRVVRRVGNVRLLDRSQVQSLQPRGQGWRAKSDHP